MNKRRKFLGYLASTALLPFLATRARSAPLLSDADHSASIRILLDTVPDNPATRRLGAVALRRYRTADIAHTLPGRLFGPLDTASAPTADRVRSRLQALRETDFAAGDTVTLDGWILARSEADAMAVVALYRAA